MLAPELEAEADAILEDLPVLPSPSVGSLAAPHSSLKRIREGGGPHYNGKTCAEAGHAPADCKILAKKVKTEQKQA